MLFSFPSALILPGKSRHKRCPYPVDQEEHEMGDGREKSTMSDLHGRIQAGSVGTAMEDRGVIK
jgi:hypothetical protein